MRVVLVPSATGESSADRQFTTSVLIDDVVAIDAGCLGFYRSPEEQARVKHVFLTHTHLDHLASLPTFLLNAFGDGDCPTIYGTEVVLDCLRRDLFNGRLWPDFLALAEKGPAYLELRALEPGRPVEAAHLRLTPVAVNHVVPTTGFLVEDGRAAVLFSADTGPTEELWEVANRTTNLKAVFLEVAFPNEQQWLADVSKHLTPRQFAAEARKVRRAVPFVAVHILTRERDMVVEQLRQEGLPDLRVGQFGVPYEF